MHVFVFDYAFGNLAGEVVSDGNVDVVGCDRKCLNNQRLNQQASHDFAFCIGNLKILVELRKEFFGKRHVRRDAEVLAASLKPFHMTVFHTCKLN